METPRNTRLRPQRSLTPKMSERKKSLFKKSSIIEENDLDLSLDGIELLSDEIAEDSVNELLHRNRPKVISFLNESGSVGVTVDDIFDNIERPTKKKSENSETVRRSPRNRLNTNNSELTNVSSPKGQKLPKNGKENALVTTKTTKTDCTAELQNLFSNSMSLKTAGKKWKSRVPEKDFVIASSDEESSDKAQTSKKRTKEPDSDNFSSKIRKLDYSSETKTHLISTKCFYANSRSSPKKISPLLLKYTKPAMSKISPKSHRRAHMKSSRAPQSINKGLVRHKIRRPPKLKKKPELDLILRNIGGAKKWLSAESPTPTSVIEKSPTNTTQPLTLTESQPQGLVSQSSSSDSESEADSFGDHMDFTNFSFGPNIGVLEQKEMLEIEEAPSTSKRKFFKSGQSSTRKEVQLANNIKATMTQGKLMLNVAEKKAKKIKKKKTESKFSAEQAKVESIIKNLETFVSDPDGPEFGPKDDINPSAMQAENYDEFRNRVPYNTTDPEKIENQHLLLDFLITNKICTEENFEIFIADSNNRRAEAELIVSNMEFSGGGEGAEIQIDKYDEFRARIPYETTDPQLIEQQKRHLDILINNDICTEENFDIFISDFQNRNLEADAILTALVAVTCDERSAMNVKIDTSVGKPSTSSSQEKLFPIFYRGQCEPIRQISTRKVGRKFVGGYGLNQYQIDAGQKEFGPKQCKQCGLVYTVHEPEEEKVHEDYHQSLYILRFKGWIDEDVVISYPEWGNDSDGRAGRIIRITENSHLKRRERVREVLDVVDKELGFSSYIFPKKFVCYFAVRKNQIVGLCLVQHLQMANKYICVNGVDCCTEEWYEARCGISRIWVSPFHRRIHIGQKLIYAVQSFTSNEVIPLEKIAFSAPTEDGKAFAKKVTKLDNFLVYQ